MMHEGHHHDHEHEHCCGEHTHEHTHEHEHHHHHEHEEVQVAEKYKKVATLLAYMSNHNADHAQELVDMAGKLREMGLEDAATQIEAGVADFNEGNKKLQAALEIVKKAE
jgi:Cd2+/Zn2+-exporting ATPase